MNKIESERAISISIQDHPLGISIYGGAILALFISYLIYEFSEQITWSLIPSIIYLVYLPISKYGIFLKISLDNDFFYSTKTCFGIKYRVIKFHFQSFTSDRRNGYFYLYGSQQSRLTVYHQNDLEEDFLTISLEQGGSITIFTKEESGEILNLLIDKLESNKNYS